MSDLRDDPQLQEADCYMGTVRYNHREDFLNGSICHRIEREGVLA